VVHSELLLVPHCHCSPCPSQGPGLPAQHSAPNNKDQKGRDLQRFDRVEELICDHYSAIKKD
jgi:hypothetical protein